jgi:NADH-quinone oxidoreductase subunit I
MNKPKPVKRVKPTLFSRLYLPSIFAGMRVTLRHIFLKKDTLQYPEEQRKFGERYRGVPVLVKDQDGRTKCVACYMCQWICPPLAISIEAGEIPVDDGDRSQIEKEPDKFEINMLRCIYCGLCEEACPEEAIFMSKTYVVTGYSRELMIFDKEKLYEIGGVREDGIKKWSESSKGPRDRSHVVGDSIAPTTAESH